MPVRNSVRPAPPMLTEDDVRELLARSLRKLCSEHGPTRVAKSLGGVDERTIRRGRDEQTTLCLDTAVNLLGLDGTALDPFLEHFGRRSVPSDAVCDTDALPAMTGAVHKLVMAASPTSPGGAELTRCELLDAEPDLRGAYDAISMLLSTIEQMKRDSGV